MQAAERSAERASLPGVFDRMIERRLRETERAGSQEKPGGLITLVQHPAAFVRAADDMVAVDMAIVEIERTRVGRAPAELAVLLAAGVALGFVRNQKQRDAGRRVEEQARPRVPGWEEDARVKTGKKPLC